MVGWASLAAFSVIFSYLITFLLGVSGILFGVLLLLGMLKSGLSIFGVILVLFALILGGTVLWSLVPHKIAFGINGVAIDLARESRLRAEIEVLAKTLNEKMPDEVYLVAAANAAVLEHGKRRIMLLGLPLLQLLTVSQFRAVLAHEFGHYYAGDTRMGPWIFRARMNMAQVLTRLGEDSGVLSFLSRWAVVAILRLVILGAISLWWSLFNRLTQFVLRKQEYRCDELACCLAGSESLEKGLCSLNRAAATFGSYWNGVVVPIAARGYQPQLADGYGRFLQVPEVAKIASAALEQRLARNVTDPMDSHPPLNARVEKARRLAIPTGAEDARPAVTLFEDLPGFELQLLARLLPALKPADFKPMHWDTAGSEVYVPLWRTEVAAIAPALNSVTIYTLPDVMAKLRQIGDRIADPPGMLLTHEQRAGRASDAIGHGLALALIDHGWRLHLQPGQFYVEGTNGRKLNPVALVRELREGRQSPEKWLQYCEMNEIADWPLVLQSA